MKTPTPHSSGPFTMESQEQICLPRWEASVRDERPGDLAGHYLYAAHRGQNATDGRQCDARAGALLWPRRLFEVSHDGREWWPPQA